MSEPTGTQTGFLTYDRAAVEAAEKRQAQMAACLRGEHEPDGDFLGNGWWKLVNQLDGSAHAVALCKHCRGLCVPRGQGEPTP